MRRYVRGQVAHSPQDGDPRNAAPLLNVLRQVDLFHGFSRAHLLVIMDICSERVYHLGDSIVEENMPGSELYVIIEGAVEILLNPGPTTPENVSAPNDAQPEPSVIATLWPGQIFGEIGLVDQGVRSASARAASKITRLEAIEREQLLMLCDRDHDFGYLLMRNIAGDLAFKIRNTDIILRERLFWECVLPNTAD